MALFSNNKEAVGQETQKQDPIQQEEVVEQGNFTDYLGDFEGQGLDGFTQDTVSTAYLAMVQPGSSASLTDAPGTWRNSATGENYGTAVEVIPLAFKTVWVERDKDPPYATVGRYEPHGIDVNVERPKPGQRGFPKMFNPITGNKIEELFLYAVTLKEHPEAGVLYFSPTVGSMKACKAWNSLLRSQHLPSGKLAPIFAFSWELLLDLVQNPAKPNNPNEKITKFVKAKLKSIVAKDLFTSYVQPQLQGASNILMIAAPEATGDVEE
jgi:hypothetical protein